MGHCTEGESVREDGDDSNISGGKVKCRPENHFAFITDAIIVMV